MYTHYATSSLFGEDADARLARLRRKEGELGASALDSDLLLGEGHEIVSQLVSHVVLRHTAIVHAAPCLSVTVASLCARPCFELLRSHS